MVKNLPANTGDAGDTNSIPELGRSSGGGHGKRTPVFPPGKFHGQRSLEGYSPWSHKESYKTEVNAHACMQEMGV